MRLFLKSDPYRDAGSTIRGAIVKRFIAQTGPRDTDSHRALAFITWVQEPNGASRYPSPIMHKPVAALDTSSDETRDALHALILRAEDAAAAASVLQSLGETHADEEAVFDLIDRFHSDGRYRVQFGAMSAYRKTTGSIAARGCALATKALRDADRIAAAARLLLANSHCTQKQRTMAFKATASHLAKAPQHHSRSLLTTFCANTPLRTRTLKLAKKQLRRATEISDYHGLFEAIAACQPNKSPRAALAPWLGRSGDIGRSANRKLRSLEARR